MQELSATTVSQLVASLKKCTKTKDFEQGKKLHQDAITANFHTNKYVASILITFYSKCRSIDLAQQVFDQATHQDVVCWNSLIMGYITNGEYSHALDLITKMNCEPDSLTYVAGLKACASLASLAANRKLSFEKGAAFHKQIKARGFESNKAVATTLVSMYSKCGRMGEARKVFDRMTTRDVVAWNSLMLGYVENGNYLVALNLFYVMDCEPSPVGYVAGIKACGGLATERGSGKEDCVQKGMAMHKRVSDHGLESNIVIANSLIEMYSKCSCMHLAQEVFDKLVERDVISWNSLIRGYVENEESCTAMDLFGKMDCEPSSVTYVSVLMACGSFARERETEKKPCLEKGRWIHSMAEYRGNVSDINVANALVDMYGKCGSMNDARKVFDTVVSRDVIIWTSLIAGYVENGEYSKALEVFGSMDCEPDGFTCVAVLKACGSLAVEQESEKQPCLHIGRSIHNQATARGLCSQFVATALQDMYSKCGSMPDARKVFDSMTNRSAVAWTSLILGYIASGENSIALELFESVEYQPDSITCAAVLKACANLDSLPAGKQIHGKICQLGLEERVSVAHALMDFYLNLGNMSRLEVVFNSIHSPAKPMWNILVAGYASSGDTALVFNLTKIMQEAGLDLDNNTLASILAACSRAGLVDEGKFYFESARRDGVHFAVEHYNCMVDLLCRVNRMQDALDLIKSMPFEANEITWMTMLGECRNWNNLDIGRVAFDQLVAKGTTNAAAYVLMSDIYRKSHIVNTLETEKGK